MCQKTYLIQNLEVNLYCCEIIRRPWDFFLHSSHLVHTEYSEDGDSLLYRARPS